MITPVETKLMEHLSRFVSDHKKEFVERVLSHRTRHITVVLENIYQSQNASAVIRTSECMGLQDIHIIENTAKYQLNVRVLKGSDKWLSLHRYKNRAMNNTEVCFDRLRKEGYTLFVADPAEDGIPLTSIDPVEAKVAIVFGNELRGASDYALEHADKKVKIPMFGFTESLNISVSVAIFLHELLPKLRNSGTDFYLKEDEKNFLRLQWYKKIVKRSEVLEREFLRAIQYL